MTLRGKAARNRVEIEPEGWLGPDLRVLSLEARGLWVDIRCMMKLGPSPGRLVTRGGSEVSTGMLGRMAGVPEDVAERCVSELLVHGFLEDDCGALWSPELVRKEQIRAARAAGGRKGGNPRLTRKDNLAPRTRRITSKDNLPEGGARITSKDKHKDNLADVKPSGGDNSGGSVGVPTKSDSITPITVASPKGGRKQKTVPEWARNHAGRLAKMLEDLRGVRVESRRVTAWAKSFQLLETRDGVDRKRQDKVLEWYPGAYGQQYVPVAESGASFREKFLRLEARCDEASGGLGLDSGSGVHRPSYDL